MKWKGAEPTRLGSFSDCVISVIITIMVLELRPPILPTLGALKLMWPTFLSYCVSYLFVGIVWVNHHHLLRLADRATPQLVWSNLAFLFTVSLIPFATAWMASTHIARIPVAVYGFIFCTVNLTYSLFEAEVLRQTSVLIDGKLRGLRRRSRIRNLITLLIYAFSAGIALRIALLGFAMLFLNTLVYVVPDKFTWQCASESFGTDR